ncbi:hypothetical protein HRG_004094 [Hirsutella rhossiliensis]|uniref:Uncharacterized protein n=1 Tax=Hirsutella rhossiliensis TaxID=111463 RepID=A0A9P8SK85_9HYPO|nr:uncharacterized protein HRG_04094 [Hirsutella rhossiliensis]KAH0966078.1 hypothetical protein HRG_04094 [Hirsutella rhossiliensis]
MRFSRVALAAAVTAVHAERPDDVSICDYYTKALLNENTPQNQATLLTVLVNTVVIGNYTLPNVGVQVPGILTAGQVDGVHVDLLPYFDGRLKSTNTGSGRGESVSFLDGGGADPLRRNLPANNKNSRQYFLLHHLYTFFGSLLRCSMQGGPGFNLYNGHASMYQVHKYMGLNHAEVSYFIQQVGLAAASFGVARNDIDTIANALNTIFNVRCAPPVDVIHTQGPQLQSICVDAESCKLAPGARCEQYENLPRPDKSDSWTPGFNGTSASYGPGATGSWGSGNPAGGFSSPPPNSFIPFETTLPNPTVRGSAAGVTVNLVAAAAALAAFLL